MGTHQDLLPIAGSCLHFASCSHHISAPTVASFGHLVSGDVIINDGVVFPVEKCVPWSSSLLIVPLWM